MSCSPFFHIVRGHECRDDPCAALQALAARIYGSSIALPISYLRIWYEKNPSIFRIAVTSENSIVGYISSLPLLANIFERTIGPDFQERTITAEDIDCSLCPSDGGVFISSILVAPEYQKWSIVSYLLRKALIEDFIAECPKDVLAVRMSAQTLSAGGEACMRSLGLNAHGFTISGWKVYYGRVGKTALHVVKRKLQQKIDARLKPPEHEM